MIPRASITIWHSLFAAILLVVSVSLADPTTIPLPFQYTIHSPINTARNSDPIGPLADRMGNVVTDLTALKTNQPVQIKQKEIVSSLNDLIAQLERQKSGNGGSNPNPTRPMTRSQIVGGPGGSGPLHDPHAGTKLWGQLPPKERDQILQSQTEGFPPGYESVLANYYTRLSQNQTGTDSASADVSPTTQPANP
jgi:hypothetical protein